MREDELHKSHVTVRSDGRVVGYRETPYITVISGGMSMTLKAGQFWTSGGTPVDIEDVPDAIWAEVERLSDGARDSVGIDLKSRAPAEITPAASEPDAKGTPLLKGKPNVNAQK